MSDKAGVSEGDQQANQKRFGARIKALFIDIRKFFYGFLYPWKSLSSKEAIDFFKVWNREREFLDKQFKAMECIAETSRHKDNNEESGENVQCSHINDEEVVKETLPKRQRGRDVGGQYKRVGLAMSGGGIRAASFSLGVMQGLNLKQEKNAEPAPKQKTRLLDHVDYLSSVSGGGYAASAYTRYRRLYVDALRSGNAAPGQPLTTKDKLKDIDLRHFPEPEYDVLMRDESRMLDFTRFRRNHLTPTRSLNFVSLFAVLMRTMLLSWPVYFTFLTVLIGLYYIISYWMFGSATVSGQCGWGFPQGCWTESARWLFDQLPVSSPDHAHRDVPQVALGLLLLVSSMFWYGFLSCLAYPMSLVARPFSDKHYELRRLGQQVQGFLLAAAFCSVFLILVPLFSQTVMTGGSGELSWGWASFILALTAGGNLFGGFSLMSLSKGTVVKRFLTAKSIIIISAFVILFGNIIIAYEFAEFIIAQAGLWVGILHEQSSGPFHPVRFWGAIVGVVVFLGLGFVTELNYVSLNRMYRDRLMEAFMPDIKAFDDKLNHLPAVEANMLYLHECQHRPLHIVNTNVVLSTSPESRYRGRSGDNFILSPFYCGSWATGYRETNKFSVRPPKNNEEDKRRDKGMTLATAMAISGAAINPRTGPGGSASVLSNPVVASLASALNLRLGCWVASPTAAKQDKKASFFNAGLQGILNVGFEEEGTKFVELTDGGHFENTGIFELLRRRADLIILSDASTDQEFNFKDIGIAIERARVDQSIEIQFLYDDYDLTHLMPGSAGDEHYDKRYGLAKRGYAVAKIKYPGFSSTKRKSEDEWDFKEKTGFLIYLKAAVTRKMPGDIYSYKGAFEQFPHQPISDQMYDESQFESYRELGFNIAKAMSDDLYNDIEAFLDRSERDEESNFFWNREMRNYLATRGS